jgi:hypothetical protein
MEKERVQAHVAGLEQIIRNAHFDLTEMMLEFEEICRRITPHRIVPPTITARVRKTYREIQDQLTKIREVDQLLKSRYRQYYHRDSRRNKEITESVFLAKNLYLKFESTLQQIQAYKKLKDKGGGFEPYGQPVPPSAGFHPQRELVFSLEKPEESVQVTLQDSTPSEL